MGKTLIVNMDDVNIEGDILDVTYNNTGVIYDISKEIQSEISVDYVDKNTKYLLKGQKYDACTFFFNLNNIFGNKKRKVLIKLITNYIKEGGKIYLWDVNKNIGRIVNNKVRIILPNNKIKEGRIKNKNIFNKCDGDEISDIIGKYYNIDKKKIWEEIFYVEGTKKKSVL